ncbi:CBS domain-containing protein [Streptomyces sp. NBC_01296]|uniref:CBS domain-containing protein n=1 Tax=Streptomyces sp. NBC_01296 TaxID=2903816 RepID=UPI002E10532D|nr:CBS domain-containing protein [Streptomyces sp. NBC_01296]
MQPLRTVDDFMTHAVISVDTGAQFKEILETLRQWRIGSLPVLSRLMRKHQIKRLPVVDGENRVVGILSRCDLLRLFLRRDRAIQEEILEDVLTRTLRLSPSALTVDITDGVVTLSGTAPRSVGVDRETPRSRRADEPDPDPAPDQREGLIVVGRRVRRWSLGAHIGSPDVGLGPTGPSRVHSAT